MFWFRPISCTHFATPQQIDFGLFAKKCGILLVPKICPLKKTEFPNMVQFWLKRSFFNCAGELCDICPINRYRCEPPRNWVHLLCWLQLWDILSHWDGSSPSFMMFLQLCKCIAVSLHLISSSNQGTRYICRFIHKWRWSCKEHLMWSHYLWKAAVGKYTENYFVLFFCNSISF